MTFYYALLLVFGAAVALLGIMAFLIRTDKKRDSKEYDERQQAVRGKACQWAVVVGMAYFAVIALWDIVLADGLQTSVYLLVMIGLALEAFVMECYCIFHDAYLPLTKSPKANIIALYVMGALQMLNAVSLANSMRVVWTEQGVSKVAFGEVMLTDSRQSASVWTLLLVGITSIFLATLELIRYLRDRGNEV